MSKKLKTKKKVIKHKLTHYTIINDIDNYNGSIREHIIEKYADETEENAEGVISREEREVYWTDKELDQWGKIEGTEEEVAEWRELRAEELKEESREKLKEQVKRNLEKRRKNK